MASLFPPWAIKGDAGERLRQRSAVACQFLFPRRGALVRKPIDDRAPSFPRGEGYRREGHPEASGHGSAKRRASRGNKGISLICGAKQGGSKGGRPSWSEDEVREGEAVSAASVGRGKAKRSPSKRSLWGNSRAFEPMPRAELTEMTVYVKFMVQFLSKRNTHVRDY
jgi:hypothetical protein